MFLKNHQLLRKIAVFCVNMFHKIYFEIFNLL